MLSVERDDSAKLTIFCHFSRFSDDQFLAQSVVKTKKKVI